MGPKSRFVRVVCKYTIILLLHYTQRPTFRALSSFGARPEFQVINCVIKNDSGIPGDKLHR